MTVLGHNFYGREIRAECDLSDSKMVSSFDMSVRMDFCFVSACKERYAQAKMEGPRPDQSLNPICIRVTLPVYQPLRARTFPRTQTYSGSPLPSLILITFLRPPPIRA